jgi:hypothetical protein
VGNSLSCGQGCGVLARQMGYVQLGEPVRFSHEWERDAALHLPAGDVSVLTQYDQQGKLRGGNPGGCDGTGVPGLAG